MHNGDPLYFNYARYDMPKETRQSNQYRIDPISLPSDAGSGTRVTSIWTTEDDDTLMSARASGMDWKTIAVRYFPAKTSNACRKRHERLMERRNAEEWGGPKLETLSKEYMAVRREMWSVLADRVGEKWQVIEAKVRFWSDLVRNRSSFLLNSSTVHGDGPQEHSGGPSDGAEEGARYGESRQWHRA